MEEKTEEGINGMEGGMTGRVRMRSWNVRAKTEKCQSWKDGIDGWVDEDGGTWQSSDGGCCTLHESHTYSTY